MAAVRGPVRGIVELEKTFRFEAAHFLPKVPPEHKCRRIHGHGYEVTVRLRGPVDPELGWLVDFGEIAAAVKPLVKALDHRLLNDIPGLENATAENLAIWLWGRLDGVLPHLLEIEVRETDSAACRYRGETVAEAEEQGPGDENAP